MYQCTTTKPAPQRISLKKEDFQGEGENFARKYYPWGKKIFKGGGGGGGGLDSLRQY